MIFSNISEFSNNQNAVKIFVTKVCKTKCSEIAKLVLDIFPHIFFFSCFVWIKMLLFERFCAYGIAKENFVFSSTFNFLRNKTKKKSIKLVTMY